MGIAGLTPHPTGMYKDFKDWTARWLHYLCVSQGELDDGSAQQWFTPSAVNVQAHGEFKVCNPVGKTLYATPSLCLRNRRRTCLGCHHICKIVVFNHPNYKRETDVFEPCKMQLLNERLLSENDATVTPAVFQQFMDAEMQNAPSVVKSWAQIYLKHHRIDPKIGMNGNEFLAFIRALLAENNMRNAASIERKAAALVDSLVRDSMATIEGDFHVSTGATQQVMQVSGSDGSSWIGKHGFQEQGKFRSDFFVVKFSGIVMDSVPDVLEFVLKTQVCCVYVLVVFTEKCSDPTRHVF